MTWGNPPKFVPAPQPRGKKITPEALAKSGTEDGHQAALFAWAADNVGTYPQLAWLFAIPNGGSRHIAEATKMVATGTRSGVPDVFLPDPYGLVSLPSYHGLFIEMKHEKYRNRKNGGCSDEQIEWLAALESSGYFIAVCYSWIEAKDVLINYLEGKL
jgi:hypothetical protein